MSPTLPAAPSASDIDARRFRDAMGMYASGITIVTGREGDEPIGFTCQSFYSVSLEPPLVSFSVMKTSSTYPRIREAGRFTVNVLAHDQHTVSRQFARSGTDKWAGIDWTPAASGNPALAGTLMWVDCEAWAEYDAGDHWIVVGRVVEVSAEDWHAGEPLIFFRGAYRHLRAVEAA